MIFFLKIVFTKLFLIRKSPEGLKSKRKIISEKTQYLNLKFKNLNLKISFSEIIIYKSKKGNIYFICTKLLSKGIKIYFLCVEKSSWFLKTGLYVEDVH